MVLDRFGLDLVRQQPTRLGLRRDRPEDGLLGERLSQYYCLVLLGGEPTRYTLL